MDRAKKNWNIFVFCMLSTLPLIACGEDVDVVIEDTTSTDGKTGNGAPAAPVVCHIWKSKGATGDVEVWIRDLSPAPLKATLRCEMGRTCNLKMVATNPHALGVWALATGYNAVNFQTVTGGWWDLSHCTFGSGTKWQADVVSGQPKGGYIYIE